MITTNDALAHALLDGIDAVFNAGTLTIRTGAPPGAGNAATGTILATITLPADAFAAASGRTKARLGTWSATIATTGTAGHFRLVGGSSTLEGDVTATGGGGDMTFASTSFVAGGVATVDTFALGNTNAAS